MESFEDRARHLERRAEKIGEIANPIARASEAGKMVDEVTSFLVDLARQVDALTPYIDERGL